MKRFVLFILILTGCWVNQSLRAQIYSTQSYSETIRTLQVHHSGGWDKAPIVLLHSDETVDISFDLLSASPEYFTYRIVHCDADWKQSQLTESEYMTGLQHVHVDDYANSFNTQPDYVNYRIVLPSDLNRLKVSGNYAVEVYGESDDPVLTACFSVVEPQVTISGQVSATTDKGVHSKYQAVSFDIAYGKEVRTPSQDLKVYVQQNNRRDNQAALLKPMSLQSGRAVYDHQPALIFDGGNEYRVFEMTTVQYNGLNVESIEFHSPFYHVLLKPDGLRSNRTYIFNNDINGRIYIRNQKYEDSTLESDYRIVHFYLPCERPFPEPVYILSKAFNNRLDSHSRMEYDAVEGGYVKSVLLKEGYYNYLYVTRQANALAASTALIEGNYYETENEYCIFVYFRPFGERYDRLIGVETIQFK